MSSALFQDALVTKFRETPSMHTRDIAETNSKNSIFNVYGQAITLNFDLLTPQPSRIIFVTDRSLTEVW